MQQSTFGASIHKSLLSKYLHDLRRCQTLSEFQELEQKMAKYEALRLLGIKGRLSSELRQKLLLKGLSERAAAWAIQECQRLGFLNDDEEAKRIAERLLERGYGTLYIDYKLKAKGMALSPSLRQWCRDAEPAAMKKLLAKLARKTPLQQFQALRRRGFRSVWTKQGVD